MEKGDVIDILPNAVQSIRNISDKDLQFLCIVEPEWNEEDKERLE